MLSEFRSTFLPAFLQRCGAPLTASSCSKVRIRFQVPHRAASGDVRIPDGEVRLEDDFHLLIEAKVGSNPLTADQTTDYATHLATSPARNMKLVCITQMDCFCIGTETMEAASASRMVLMSRILIIGATGNVGGQVLSLN
jgi:hypothetical protein